MPGLGTLQYKLVLIIPTCNLKKIYCGIGPLSHTHLKFDHEKGKRLKVWTY